MCAAASWVTTSSLTVRRRTRQLRPQLVGLQPLHFLQVTGLIGFDVGIEE